MEDVSERIVQQAIEHICHQERNASLEEGSTENVAVPGNTNDKLQKIVNWGNVFVSGKNIEIRLCGSRMISEMLTPRKSGAGKPS